MENFRIFVFVVVFILSTDTLRLLIMILSFVKYYTKSCLKNQMTVLMKFMVIFNFNLMLTRMKDIMESCWKKNPKVVINM